MTDEDLAVTEARWLICPDCPWPIHVRIPIDPDDPDPGMDAARRAARAHYRQHDTGG